MNNKARKMNIKIYLRRALACTLAFCVSAGAAAAASPVFAASRQTKSGYNGKTYTHSSKFNGQLVVNGVDVSDWQSKKSNWTKAKASGIDFAIMRVTYSNYGPKTLKTNNDGNFETFYKKARAAGLMCGVYVFSQAKNADEGRREAEFAVKRLKALGIGPEDLALPVYMDYEFAGNKWTGRLYGLNKTNGTNAAAAFCNTIKSYGYTPGIYASTVFFNNYIDRSKLAADVDIWCAQYYSRCELPGNYSKWQYASNGRVNGLLSWVGTKGNIDVNYWYINKKVNTKPTTVIKGRTTLSLSDAKNPKFTITCGKTTLKQGRDYMVSGIRNNRKGAAYAYIKGIGNYSGYALVPITITNKSSGSTSANLNKISANYLTRASKDKSSYAGTAAASKFKKGGEYTLLDYMNIRTGAGTGYAKVKYSALSAGAKKLCLNQGGNAVLKKGTKVKVLEIKSNWIRAKVKVNGRWETLKGGWICTGMNGETYVK